MSVLVIGATGFIGPRLIRRLVARGESVVGMDLNPGAATFGDVPIGAPVIRGDVTHFEDVMRTVLDVKPDRLINLAYGLGAGEGNPHQVLRLDVLGMDNCFEAARLAGAPRHALYNSGGIPVSLGELADIVRGFLPDAQITFAEEGGREESGNYLVDWSRLAKEFGIEYPGLHTRVLEVINEVRQEEGLPLVGG